MKYNEITFRIKGQTYRIKRFDNHKEVTKELWVYTNPDWKPVLNKHFIKEVLVGKGIPYAHLPQLEGEIL